MSGLTLTYSGLSVSLTSFTGANWPRERIETPELSRTAYGTPTERGSSFEAPHLWNVSAVVSDVTDSGLSDAATLDAIYDLWLQTGGDIVLHDYSRRFNELTTRTRALATGGSVITTGSVLSYPAQFNVRFQGNLGRTRQNDSEVVMEFTLIEGAKIAA